MTPTRIAVIGAGRIGCVSAVGLAHLGHDVWAIDRSPDRIAALAAGTLPENEPGLRAALVAALRFRRLSFSTSAPPDPVEAAFLCVDTPPLPTGEVDLGQVEAAAAAAARLLVRDGVLITRSTVPPGAGDRLEGLLRSTGRADVAVVHLPEFLREGRAWQDFREPDRIVIGAASEQAAGRVSALLAQLDRPVIVTDRRTAELAKFAANAYLATSVSFANEIDDLCAALAIDAPALFAVLRADRRIVPLAHLTPGLGFGGHCLPKDTEALTRIAAANGQELRQLAAVRAVNQRRIGRAVDWLRAALAGLDGRTICLAGLAFKPGADDLRASPALRLAAALACEGATVTGWDPYVRPPVRGVTLCHSLDEALLDADALVLAHPLAEPARSDPEHFRRLMRRPVVFDAPATLDARRWQSAGFRINRPPRGDVTHPAVATASPGGRAT